MDRSPEELRSEIDDIREDLGETLEAVGDRVAPKKVVARAKADLADKVDDVKEKVSPARLARRGADAVRQGVRSVVGSGSGNGNGHGSGNGSGSASIGGGQLSGRAGTVRAQSPTVGARAGSAASTVVDNVRDAPQGARRKAEGNPVAAGLLAFAGGFFAAALLPPTDREKQLTDKAKEKLEPITKSVAEAGKSVAGELQSSAQQSLEKVKETATEAAGQVKGTAESSVGTVKERATDATETVTKEAKGATSRVKRQAKGSTEAVKGEAKEAAGRVKRQAAPKRPSAGPSRARTTTRTPARAR
jgi:gas vesicle protein/ElaB/YqjD/DUF883 family membrane-anchored ribosome-binding protein